MEMPIRNVDRVEELPELPTRAKSFRRVVEELSQNGVKWTAFYKIQDPKVKKARDTLKKYGQGMDDWFKFQDEHPDLVHKATGDWVMSGLQAVGDYNGIPVVMETNVGVRKHSSGYAIKVGDEIRSANSSTKALNLILSQLEQQASDDEGNSKTRECLDHFDGR